MSYFSILSAALEFIKLVPNLINKLTASNALSFSEKIIEVAKALTQQSNEQSALEQLQNNPHLLLEFQKLTMEIDEKMYQTSHKEHKNARSRDLEIFRAGKQNLRAHLMVLIAAIGLLACPIALVMSLKNYDINIPGEIIVIISTIAGVFGACLKDAYAFEFGSSKHASNKKFNNISHMMSDNHNNSNHRKLKMQKKHKIKNNIKKLFKKIKSYTSFNITKKK